MDINFATTIDGAIAAPAASGRAVISGPQRMGAILTVQDDSLTNVTSRQWKADGVNISGQTGSTHIVQSMMEHVSCEVVADEGTFETPAVWIYHNHDEADHNAIDDAALAIIPHTDCDKIAIADGDWSDDAIWSDGVAPVAGSVVLIPWGRTVTYDVAVSPRFDRIRVDGRLEWALDQSTDMLVETLLGTIRGVIEQGNPSNRLPAQHNIEVRFSDRDYQTDPTAATPIDIARDPELLGRGLIHHGEWTAWGLEVTPWERTSTSVPAPMSGDTSATLAAVPTNWTVGDTIVIGSTNFVIDQNTDLVNDENEVRVITTISGNVVGWATPLTYNHHHQNTSSSFVDPGDLRPAIFNKKRNITLRSENPNESQPFLRGHTMSMHSAAKADIWHVAALDMGRTDKSGFSGIKRDGLFTRYSGSSSLTTEPMSATVNLQSRYPFHAHFCGFGRGADTAHFEGCYVENAPAWGYVHHGCQADFVTNVCFRYVGAGMVSETADELGSWVDNLMIGCRDGFNGLVAVAGNPKNAEGTRSRFGDFGRIGMGMFFRGRAMRVSGNMIMGAPLAYVFFHRAVPTAQLSFKRLVPRAHVDVKTLSVLEYRDGFIDSEDYPIRHFSNNEAAGIQWFCFSVTKSNSAQNHDLPINIPGMKFWACGGGTYTEYIGTYNFIGSRLYASSKNFPGITKTGSTSQGEQLSHINSTIVGFARAFHIWGKGNGSNGTNDNDWNDTNNPAHYIANPTLIGNTTDYDYFNLSTQPGPNTVQDTTRIDGTTPTPTVVTVTGPLILYDWDGGNSSTTAISNFQTPLTKTDVLGTSNLPKIWDNSGLYYGTAHSAVNNANQTGTLLREHVVRNGYYTYQGDNIAVWTIYVGDRAEGRPIVHTVAARNTDTTPVGTSNGELVLSETGPSRADMTFNVTQRQEIAFDVLTGATGEAGATLSMFGDYLKPNNGEMVDNLDGTYSYRSDARFVGTDTAYVFIDDGRHRYGTVRIDFNVTAA